MNIEPMQPEDVHILFALAKQEWPTDTWLTQQYIKQAYGQPGVSLVAQIDTHVVGGIILVHEDIVPNWIRLLIVDTPMRAQGIASALLQATLATFPSGTSIFVDTGVKDEIAIQFYKKNGFTMQGQIKELYDTEDALILRMIV
jgi:ribosomal protein S18 acetylase RimI-like enzyme